MRFLKWALVLAVAAYVVGVAALYVFQRALLYPAISTHTTPAEAGFPQAEEVVLDTSDREKVIAWHVPPKPDKLIILYFHGNGEIVAWRAVRHRQLVSDGTGLLALSYRGYMGSSGHPTEDGLRRDAEAAYDFAVSRYDVNRIVVWGHSLGSGVAVRLASERPIRKLILEAPYTSTVDVAASLFPFVPVRLLMRDQFRSDQRIGSVTAPVLILHGERDNAIPIAFGERMFSLAREPKRFVRFADGGHIDLDDHGALQVVRSFLAEP
jgi:fermentation-respiration switch protein FrsA (DUF1100 family)